MKSQVISIEVLSDGYLIRDEEIDIKKQVRVPRVITVAESRERAMEILGSILGSPPKGSYTKAILDDSNDTNIGFGNVIRNTANKIANTFTGKK